MKRREFLGSTALAAATAMLTATRAFSQETITWKALAHHANGAQYNKWIWLQEELPKRTDGRINLEITTSAELGLTGFEVLRVLQTGLVDIAEVNIGFVSGDFPMIEATELPGLGQTYDEGRALMTAWMKNVVAPAGDIMGGKVIGNFSWNSAFLFTAFTMESLDDLQGKKIRVYSPGLAKYLEHFGAEPISMTTTEVYGALQRGVIDGLLTGSDQISAMSLWEVAPHMYDIGLAPFGAYIVVSERTWNNLPDDLRLVVEQIGADMTALGWKLGQDNNDAGIAAAREHDMTVEVSAPADWLEQLSHASREQVVPWWTSRAGAGAAEKFNEILAPLTGFTVD